MAQRFLNRVQLIGNVVATPTIRQVNAKDPVCQFSIATNRYWKSDGVEKEDTQFHRLIAWGKLAEICAQLLTKGRKVYAEGRLATRKFTDKTGVERESTEIVLDDLILLDSKPKEPEKHESSDTDQPF